MIQRIVLIVFFSKFIGSIFKDNVQIDGLIQKYYTLIVEKAKIYKAKSNVFNIDKAQNQLALYLKECNLDKLLFEVGQIQYLDSLIFEVNFYLYKTI